MTTGDPKKMAEFALRPHHIARKITTNVLTGLFRDDWPRHDCPYNEKGWFDYWDEIYLGRLNYLGKAMGWKAPRMQLSSLSRIPSYDSENVDRARQWKPVYHVMRMILVSEISMQVLNSDHFTELVRICEQPAPREIPAEFKLPRV